MDSEDSENLSGEDLSSRKQYKESRLQNNDPEDSDSSWDIDGRSLDSDDEG